MADNQTTSRIEAVVLHVHSLFHSRDAMVNEKQYLAHHQVQEAAVRDCFPPATMELAHNLNRYGGNLRPDTRGTER